MRHHPRIRRHRQHRESKDITLARHTKNRMRQRFEMDINDDEVRHLAKMCQTNQYLCHLEKQSNSRGLFAVEFRNRIVPVIYDRNRHCIVTVLSENMLSGEECKKIDTMYLRLHNKPYIWTERNRIA